MKLAPRKKEDTRPRRAAASYKKQQVFSYRASRREIDRPFDRGNKAAAVLIARKLRIKHWSYYVFIVIFLIGIGYILSVGTNAQLNIRGEQTYLRDKQAYQQKINAELSKDINSRSKVTIDINELEQNIRQLFPEVEHVSVSTPILRHRPVVELTLGEPKAVLVTPGISYVLNADGRALFELTQASGALDTGKLLRIKDDSGHSLSIGKTAITGAQINYVREVALQLADKNIVVEQMLLSAGGGQLDVKLLDASYQVRFSFQADARQSVGSFLALRERLAGESVVPVEYIDVRIPERAYIK